MVGSGGLRESAGVDDDRTNVLRFGTQHFSGTWRQTGVGTDLRGLAVVMTRTVAMLLIAILLILVLLPAALAANGVCPTPNDVLDASSGTRRRAATTAERRPVGSLVS